MRPLFAVIVSLSTLLPSAGQAQAPPAPAGNGRISGRIVTSASRPVGGATVALGMATDYGPSQWQAWWATQTDAAGFYEFDGLPAGQFTVIAVRDGFAGWQSTPRAAPAPLVAGSRTPALAFALNAPRLTIALVPGGHASEANMTLFRPGAVSGRALRPDGSPAAKTPLVLYVADDSGAIVGTRGSGPTDLSGAYSFTDLGPGTYYIGVPYGRLQDVDPRALTAVTIAEGISARSADVPLVSERGLSIKGRIADAAGRVPKMLRLDYGTPSATHSGLLSSFGPDGTFEIVDRKLEPGPVTLMASGDTDDGPVVGLLTTTLVDSANDVDVIVGKAGTITGRVSMRAAGAASPVVRLSLVREGFQPLGEGDRTIDIAPDGWLEVANLIGAYRVRVDAPRQWSVESVRRRGLRLPNDRLVVGNGEALDDVEIVIGPR